MKEFLSFYSTNSLSRSNLNYENGNIKNIHYGDIHTKFPSIINCESEEIPYINLDIDSSRIKEDSYCKDSDLIIADASENYDDIGKAIELINVGNQKIVAGLHTILARDTADITVPGFKGYLFQTDNLKKQIKIVTNGISVLGISKNNLKDLYVNIPSKEEQEKIVRFLFLIDKKIELLEKTLVLYQKVKEYFLLNFLKNNLRFKEFEGDFDKFKLKDIVKRITRKNKNKECNRVLTISAQDGLIEQNEFFNKNIASDNLENYYLIYNNEFAFNKSYSNGYPYGAIKRLKNYEKGLLSTLYICFIAKENINSEFLEQYFESSLWHHEIYKIAVEGARNHGLLNISIDDFLNTNHILPKSFKEQEKIAKFLSLIDKKIELSKKKKKLWEENKKGLLQKMFV